MSILLFKLSMDLLCISIAFYFSFIEALFCSFLNLLDHLQIMFFLIIFHYGFYVFYVFKTFGKMEDGGKYI